MPRLLIPDNRQDRILHRDYAIDWQNPLTFGLKFAAYLGGQNRVDLVGQGVGTLLTSGSWGGKTLGGNALESTSESNGGAHFAHNGTLESITKNFSIYVLVDIDVTGTSSGALLTVPYGATHVTPFFSIVLHRRSTTENVTCGFTNGTTYYNNFSLANGYWLAGHRGIGVSRDATSLYFYKNGVFGETASISGNPVAWSATDRDVTLLNQNSEDNGGGTDGRMSVALVWGRPLSSNEMALIHGDPRRILAPRKRRAFMAPAVVGSSITQRRSIVEPGIRVGSRSFQRG